MTEEEAQAKIQAHFKTIHDKFAAFTVREGLTMYDVMVVGTVCGIAGKEVGVLDAADCVILHALFSKAAGNCFLMDDEKRKREIRSKAERN